MFGYVKTDLPNTYVKDTILYKAMYCGLCKGIGGACGQKARLVLNYDLTFLSVLVHNLAGKDVKVEKQRCIIHWFTKRPVAVPDELTERVAALNVILARYKLSDDVADDGKGRMKRAFFSSSYKRAKKKEPRLDEIVKNRYSELVAYEKKGGDSIDFAADPFGNMTKDIAEELLKENCTEDVSALAYGLGKWIYLIDALDDFDKDRKKKNYNVFVASYPDVSSQKQLMEERGEEITAVFGAVIGDVGERAKRLSYKFNHDLTDNILLKGLLVQTKKVMEKEKWKNTTKS